MTRKSIILCGCSTELKCAIWMSCLKIAKYWFVLNYQCLKWTTNSSCSDKKLKSNAKPAFQICDSKSKPKVRRRSQSVTGEISSRSRWTRPRTTWKQSFKNGGTTINQTGIGITPTLKRRMWILKCGPRQVRLQLSLNTRWTRLNERTRSSSRSSTTWYQSIILSSVHGEISREVSSLGPRIHTCRKSFNRCLIWRTLGRTI